jgi:putative PEP-CTERM system histidine kinase
MSQLIANLSSWYAAAGTAFLVLGVYVVVTGGLLRNQFVGLAACGMIWAGYSAGVTTDASGFHLDTTGFAFELVFMFAWFVVLYRLLRGPYKQSMPETVRRGLYLFWLTLVAAGALVIWFVYLGDLSDRGKTYFHIIALSASLLVFALAAQFKRDAPLEDRRSLNALALASALIGAVQALVFGVATMVAAVPVYLLNLRVAASLAAAMLLIYGLRRRPQWSLAIFVSPQARAYAPRFLATGGILLVLLAATPLFREFSPPTVQPLATLLIAVIIICVAALLFSESLSARLRVFVSKHFLPFRYDYREEWLRLIDTLASPDQCSPLPERSIKAVAQIVNSPAGVLWLRNREDGPFSCAAHWKTKAWLDMAVPASDPALNFMRKRQWILDTAELQRDPALYGGLQRPDWLEQFPDALLIVPLINNEVLIGFIVLFQSSSAFRLAFEEIDLLRTSGRQVASHLAQYQADQQLAEARQFEAFNRLTAFVMHDLKNLIAQQSLMVKNAAKHKGNPQFFEDSMATIENSVARMNKLLRQLQRGDASGPQQRVRLDEALAEAIEKTESGSPEPVLQTDDEEIFTDIDRERFTAIVAHLIRNAQEATAADGSVVVKLANSDGRAVITIEDDGCGMDADFLRNRLFRPFDSTKGSQGMGIGAYQARTFVTEAGGAMDVQSSPDAGTTVSISLPLTAADLENS